MAGHFPPAVSASPLFLIALDSFHPGGWPSRCIFRLPCASVNVRPFSLRGRLSSGALSAQRPRGAAGGDASPVPGCRPGCLRSSPWVGRGFAPAGLGRVRRGWSVRVQAWAGLPPAWRGSPPEGMLPLRGCSCFALRAAYRLSAVLRADWDVPGRSGAAGPAQGARRRWFAGGLPCRGLRPLPGYPGFALRAAYRLSAVLRADWDVREVCGAAGPAQGRGKVRFTGGLPCRRRLAGPFRAPARDGRCFAPGGSHRRALPSGRRSRASGPRGGGARGCKRDRLCRLIPRGGWRPGPAPPSPRRFRAVFLALYIKGKNFDPSI